MRLPEAPQPRGPQIEISGVTTVPGWGVRLVLLALATCSAVVATGANPGAGIVVPLVVGIALVVAAPGGFLPFFFVLVVAGAQLLGSEGFSWRTFVLLLGLHLVLRLSALATQLGMRTRVEVALLLTVLLELLPFQLTAQALALLAAGVALLDLSMSGLRVLAVVGGVAVAVLLLPRVWLAGWNANTSD